MGKSKELFSLKTLNETFAFHRTGVIKLQSIRNDYYVAYIYDHANPSVNTFQFTGKKPGKDYESERITFRAKTLEEISGFIKKTYPKMSPEDWDALNGITKELENASRTLSVTANDKTRTDEEKALNKYIEFLEAHGLI